MALPTIPEMSSALLAASEETVVILKSILNTVNNINGALKNYENFLKEKEQAAEAAASEAEGESRESQGDATKIPKNKKETKTSEGSSFIEKIAGSIFRVIFAFLPQLISMFNEKKEFLKSLPEKLIAGTVNIMESITSVLKQFISEPISKFFNITLGAAIDTLFITIGNKIDSIMSIPTTLINAASLFINELLINSTQTFINFINDLVKNNPLLEKLGVTEALTKTAEAKLKALQDKRAELTTESDTLSTEKNARENVTIGGTYDSAVKERTDKYNKEHVDPMADIIKPDASKASVSNASSVEVPPEGRALLDAIAANESRGQYDIIVGAGSEKGLNAEDKSKNLEKGFEKAPARLKNFSDHPQIRGMRTSAGPSTAAGRYQITYSTWKGLKANSKLGLTDFSPENQDKAAWALAKERYKGDLLKDLKAGKIAEIGRALNKVWTSLAGGFETTQSDKGLASLYNKSLETQQQNALVESNGKGGEITPTPKAAPPVQQVVAQTESPPAQPSNNAGGVPKFIPKPDARGAQQLYATSLG